MRAGGAKIHNVHHFEVRSCFHLRFVDDYAPGYAEWCAGAQHEMQCVSVLLSLIVPRDNYHVIDGHYDHLNLST